ncbi:2-amino-4-hydroxy-6-hydroxymethyldihydropteridine diphosphokinase [Pigmentiphaga aceris]|uniref:2-amino-4-hydroxy-6-hydroxymethyldihydropteridine pyrophosphokinase n=1 Tax=Pigmentiphaga aceris TaxID=1940612 RepID=A0A5C0B2W0_9BURK|nr:2-amino-4-hydroxy-6-hydroxymethyldihydropteridine diphosphokinase [Pigmentiphaga aceris]QEI08063.1 2-amino-4-hydroxy-6-hydroxymethyldihydropteridine diphosphokinase [Pigmentiphaga aceris]
MTETTTAHHAARTAWVGLGANLGDASATLRQALSELAAAPGIADVVPSPFYRSAPVDAQGPVFVNAVTRLRTTLEPIALLDVLQYIEQKHGRDRPYRNAPRTLDLDLLLVEGVSMDSPRLSLPHPRLHQRAFVLRPLQDLDPDLVLEQGSFEHLLAACADQAIERS